MTLGVGAPQAASDVYAPLSGKVVEINEDLVKEPAKVRHMAPRKQQHAVPTTRHGLPEQRQQPTQRPALAHLHPS